MSYNKQKRVHPTSRYNPMESKRAATVEKMVDNLLDEKHLQLARSQRARNITESEAQQNQDMAPSFARQTTSEVDSDAGWTTVKGNRTEISPVTEEFEPSLAEVDTCQPYVNGLRLWQVVDWKTVQKLQIGTWIQYTTAKHPEYIQRKKVTATLGNGLEAMTDGERPVFAWTPVRDIKLAEDAGEPVNPAWSSCVRGRHCPLPIEGTLMKCTQCSSTGWRLSQGAIHKNTRYYINKYARYF